MRIRALLSALLFATSTSIAMPPQPAAADAQPVTVDLDVTLAMGDIASGLAKADYDSPNVDCDPETKANPVCARLAMRLAQAAANSSYLSGAGHKELKFVVQTSSGIAGLFGSGDEPESVEEAVKEKLKDKIVDAIKEWILKHPLADDVKDSRTVVGCGEVSLEWKLLDPITADGPPRLRMTISGDCGCKYIVKNLGQGRLGKFRVFAEGDLVVDPPLPAWRRIVRERVAKKLSIDLPWTPHLTDPQYNVFAHCADCEHHTSEQPAPVVSPSSEPAPPPEPIVERICYQRCKAEYEEWLKWKSALDRKEADAADPALMSDPATAAAIRRSLQIDRQHEAEARLAYYNCAKKCYDAAIAAHEITEVPEDITKLAPTPEPKPIDKDPAFKSVAPSVGPLGATSEQSFLPAVAGPGSAIVATIEDPAQSGPTEAIVEVVTQNGARKDYRATTDAHHRLHFTLPEELAGAAVAAVLLGRAFDRNGHLDSNAARCEVGPTAVVPNTDAVPGAPGSGSVVERASSSYERGKMVSLQTRGIDPMNAHVVVDGRTDEAVVRAASDRDVEAQLNPDVPLGKHEIGVISGTKRSNTFPARIVSLTAEPLPPAATGTVQTFTVRIEGLGDDSATMTFHVSGATQLEDGGETAVVPVKGGIAHVRIRGTHRGLGSVQFHLHVLMPFWGAH